MKALNRQDILAQNAPKLESREVPIPEWGGSIWVRQYTGQDTDYIAALVGSKRNGRVLKNSDTRPYILQRTIRDENGDLIFNTSDDDIEYLRTQVTMRIAERIMKVANELNGGDVFDMDRVESVRQDFSEDPSEDSSSS